MTKLRVITSPSGARFTVADEYADKFGGLVSDLEAAGIKINPNASGGYNYRTIRGSNRLSNHAFGRAIDVNWDENPLGTVGKINPEIARSLAKKHGLTWGGDWKTRPDPMHFEVAGVPSVPVAERAITRVAGVSKTQPTTTGAETPMPTYKPVGGQTYMGPEAALSSQKLAQTLMAQGLEQQPMTHWTQALGKVLLAGSGALRNDMAMKDIREGQAAGNQALGQLLMGGDASAAMANPYSANEALQYQQQQQILKQRADQAERLKKIEIDANRADPLYQARLNKLQAETAAMSRKPVALSVGQQALDRNFAKTYSEDIAGGAIADAVAQLGTLEAIANKLKTPGGSNVTGPVLGMVPESIRAYTNPESVDIQNQIANIVQRSLRPILGAQFTQQEGENLIKRAYNPQLSEEQNANRLIKLATVAKQMAQQKLAAAKYFEEKGTLEGFKGSANFSIADVENAVDAPDVSSGVSAPTGMMNAGSSFGGRTQSGPRPGTVEEGYRFKGGNPSDPNAWEKVQ